MNILIDPLSHDSRHLWDIIIKFVKFFENLRGSTTIINQTKKKRFYMQWKIHAGRPSSSCPTIPASSRTPLGKSNLWSSDRLATGYLWLSAKFGGGSKLFFGLCASGSWTLLPVPASTSSASEHPPAARRHCAGCLQRSPQISHDLRWPFACPLKKTEQIICSSTRIFTAIYITDLEKIN